MRGRIRAFAGVLILAGALWWVPLPVAAVQPGPVTDALDLLEIDGAPQFRPRGSFLVMTVLVEDRIRFPQALGAWLGRERSIVSREVFFPGGVSAEEQALENAAAMASSQAAAVLAAREWIARAPPRHPEDPGLGIRVVPDYGLPFEVTIATGPIGGPSAGLALALAIIDLLDAPDRSGGRRVAVTGTVDAAGNVGPVGGIRQKVFAARRARATVFLIPRANLAEAQRVAGTLRLVPVSTLTEALQSLT